MSGYPSLTTLAFLGFQVTQQLYNPLGCDHISASSEIDYTHPSIFRAIALPFQWSKVKRRHEFANISNQ
jgi:hypothetical protein